MAARSASRARQPPCARRTACMRTSWPSARRPRAGASPPPRRHHEWDDDLIHARLLFLFLILCCASLLVGARHIAWTQLFALSDALSDDTWLTLTASRLPRLAALVLTGVGLSVCGVILQQIVRNKFVEPATSGGLDAAKLGILISLTLMPGVGAVGKMLFALTFCFAAS